MSDDEGDFAVAAGGTLYVAGAFGAANGWNPLGWVIKVIVFTLPDIEVMVKKGVQS